MNIKFNSLKFDVVIVRGPQTQNWPSPGLKELSQLCTKFGLSVAWVGDDHLKPLGVIPLQGFGGLVIAQDSQNRIHRFEGRSIVKFRSPNEIPPAFKGWNSPGLMSGTTGLRLFNEANLHWNLPIALLGSTNRALIMACQLLERGCVSVTVIDEEFRAWQVLRQRFEILGGRWIQGQLTEVRTLSQYEYELHLSSKFTSLAEKLKVSRVLSFGSYFEEKAIKEYPAQSMLFEFMQTALDRFEDDPEGWMLEQEYAQLLATQLIKLLGSTSSHAKKDLEFFNRKSKSRIKKFTQYQEHKFEPQFQGKWLASQDLNLIKNSDQVPKIEQKTRWVASIECMEGIACTICETACPEKAIQWDRIRPVESGAWLNYREKDCSGCGLCLQACPSATPFMIQSKEFQSTSSLMFPWRGKYNWKLGEMAVLLNRRGENLGQARISKIDHLNLADLKKELKYTQKLQGFVLLQVDVPEHLLWEVRAVKPLQVMNSAIDQEFLDREDLLSHQWKNKVEITMNGEKRWLRGGVTLSLAFFEAGINRATDALACQDASCQLCECEIDGQKRLACQTNVRKGMNVKTEEQSQLDLETIVCPCLGLTEKELKERVKSGKLENFETIQALTHLGDGRCHGQLCLPSLKKILFDQSSSNLQKNETDVIDWSFPWQDWKIDPNRFD